MVEIYLILVPFSGDGDDGADKTQSFFTTEVKDSLLNRELERKKLYFEGCFRLYWIRYLYWPLSVLPLYLPELYAIVCDVAEDDVTVNSVSYFELI